jgi:hypothetical protein
MCDLEVHLNESSTNGHDGQWCDSLVVCIAATDTRFCCTHSCDDSSGSIGKNWLQLLRRRDKKRPTSCACEDLSDFMACSSIDSIQCRLLFTAVNTNYEFRGSQYVYICRHNCIGCSVVVWIGLAQDRYRWRALVNAVMNLRAP